MATHTSLKDYIGIAPDFKLATSVEQGLPTENLDLLRETGLTFTEMGAVIPHRTLKHRKARGENLTPEETERAMRVASTIALANKVFGDSDKAMAWLRGKDDRLKDRTPLSMLQTNAGARVVESMLWGIDEGVYSLTHLWRISNHAELTGLGGQRSSGRWHTAAPGKRIVYLSEHPALALVENLANLRGKPQFYPSTYQLLRISGLDRDADFSSETPDFRNLDMEDLDLGVIEQTQALGDRWLASATSAFLRVPSVPAPDSWNYLLNPLHPDASLLHIDWAKHITYDRRLFHLSK